jgi:exosortase
LSESSWGLLFLAFGSVVQLASGYYRIVSLEAFAVLPYVSGLFLLLGGWETLKWATPAILDLAFMIPLPFQVETSLGQPLQQLATSASTDLLQTLGFMAYADGNVIQLHEARIGVVEACSDLSMLFSFLAFSTAIAMTVERPAVDRIALVASSIPVALLSNVFRIVITGILQDTVGATVANTFYHDLAGWIMLPVALLLYSFEIWILSRVLVETETETVPVVFSLQGSKQPAKAVATATRR